MQAAVSLHLLEQGVEEPVVTAHLKAFAEEEVQERLHAFGPSRQFGEPGELVAIRLEGFSHDEIDQFITIAHVVADVAAAEA